MVTIERTLYIQTRSGKQFLVKETGEIRALNNNETCGLMIGLLHRPGGNLTLLSKVFSMFEDLSNEELLRQLAAFMDKPNKHDRFEADGGRQRLAEWDLCWFTIAAATAPAVTPPRESGRNNAICREG